MSRMPCRRRQRLPPDYAAAASRDADVERRACHAVDAAPRDAEAPMRAADDAMRSVLSATPSYAATRQRAPLMPRRMRYAAECRYADARCDDAESFPMLICRRRRMSPLYARCHTPLPLICAADDFRFIARCRQRHEPTVRQPRITTPPKRRRDAARFATPRQRAPFIDAVTRRHAAATRRDSASAATCFMPMFAPHAD